MRFGAILEDTNRVAAGTAGLVLVAAVGLVDYVTGYEIALSLFYLLPIAFVTWSAGRTAGIALSLLGSGVWITADVAAGHTYSHPAIHVWNTGIRLGFFLAVTLLVSSLRMALREAQTMARTDHLTGAVNARVFEEALDTEIERSRRYGRAFSVAYLDLDDFKAVNDRFGHAAGDRLLRALVDSIRPRLRRSDVIARLGGDEFAILFPETGADAARGVIEKIRGALDQDLRRDGREVTLSCGVITCERPPASGETIVKMADDLMYDAKRAGKNDVHYSIHR